MKTTDGDNLFHCFILVDFTEGWYTHLLNAVISIRLKVLKSSEVVTGGAL